LATWFELDPAGEHVRDIVEVADDDQTAGSGVDDIVDPLAQSTAGSDYVKGPQQPRILTFRKLMELIPGQRRHLA
jgi:hypothetical protein